MIRQLCTIDIIRCPRHHLRNGVIVYIRNFSKNTIRNDWGGVFTSLSP